MGGDVTRAEVGEGIAYSFAIKNTGSTTLLGIDVTSTFKDQALVSVRSARLVNLHLRCAQNQAPHTPVSDSSKP